MTQDLAARLEALEKQAKERETELQAKNALAKSFQGDVKSLTEKLNKARNKAAEISTGTAPLDQQLSEVEVSS